MAATTPASPCWPRRAAPVLPLACKRSDLCKQLAGKARRVGFGCLAAASTLWRVACRSVQYWKGQDRRQWYVLLGACVNLLHAEPCAHHLYGTHTLHCSTSSTAPFRRRGMHALHVNRATTSFLAYKERATGHCFLESRAVTCSQKQNKQLLPPHSSEGSAKNVLQGDGLVTLNLLEDANQYLHITWHKANTVATCTYNAQPAIGMNAVQYMPPLLGMRSKRRRSNTVTTPIACAGAGQQLAWHGIIGMAGMCKDPPPAAVRRSRASTPRQPRQPTRTTTTLDPPARTWPTAGGEMQYTAVLGGSAAAKPSPLQRTQAALRRVRLRPLGCQRLAQHGHVVAAQCRLLLQGAQLPLGLQFKKGGGRGGCVCVERPRGCQGTGRRRAGGAQEQLGCGGERTATGPACARASEQQVRGAGVGCKRGQERAGRGGSRVPSGACHCCGSHGSSPKRGRRDHHAVPHSFFMAVWLRGRARHAVAGEGCCAWLSMAACHPGRRVQQTHRHMTAACRPSRPPPHPVQRNTQHWAPLPHLYGRLLHHAREVLLHRRRHPA